MQTNRVKKILREGGLALGTYTGGIADPQIVEIIGHAGYDAAFIDMEPLGERGMAGASRASDFGKIAIKDHMEQSNREITLAVMIEDLPAVQDIDAIASIEGIDIVAVGPSDMSRALGVGGTSNHPKLVEVVHRVADAVRKGGVARLALPMNHAALPRNAAQLKELGCGYCNCAPSPEVRMLKSMQAQVAEARALL